MKVFIITLCLFATHAFAKSTKHPLGLYQFLTDHKIEQCAVYNNIGACLKRTLTLYQPGDYIESHDSYFNSKSNAWDIGFQLNGQNKSIIPTKLKYIGKANCEGLKKKYKTDIRILDYDCKIDSDCKEVGLNYNSCAGAFGVSKSVSKWTTDELVKKRQRVWNICKYIHPPCPAIPREAYCNKGRCSERSPKRFYTNDPKL